MKRALALAMLLAGAPLFAKPGTPGPDWFKGSYERIGRDGAGGPVNDRVALAPAGQGLRLMSCKGEEAALSFGPAFEVENLMSGSMAGVELACLFHNNGYLRPILTCRSADGGAFTLWPLAKAEKLAC